MSGLPSFISEKIQYDDPKTLEETIRHSKFLYEQQRERPTFQKAWEDKMKSKVDQRKKGAKPLFFRNNMQGKPTLKEPKISDIVGQNPWCYNPKLHQTCLPSIRPTHIPSLPKHC